TLAGGKIGAEGDVLDRPSFARRDFQGERRAGMKMPDLDRIHPVPMRALAARKHKIDRRGGGAPLDRARIAERLTVVAALRMRLEIEEADHLGRGQTGVHVSSRLLC